MMGKRNSWDGWWFSMRFSQRGKREWNITKKLFKVSQTRSKVAAGANVGLQMKSRPLIRSFFINIVLWWQMVFCLNLNVGAHEDRSTVCSARRTEFNPCNFKLQTLDPWAWVVVVSQWIAEQLQIEFQETAMYYIWIHFPSTLYVRWDLEITGIELGPSCWANDWSILVSSSIEIRTQDHLPS